MYRSFLVLTTLVLATVAAVADPCSQAISCCEAAMDLMGQPHTQCPGVTAGGPATCAQVRDSFVRVFTAQNKKAPAVCTGVAAPAGGGGGTGSGSDAGAGSGSGSSAGSGAGPADQPPRPLPAEDEKPAASADNKISCLVDRVDGKRVVLTGANETLEVKCAGIVDDSGTLAKPPQRTPQGGVVKIKWTISKPVGVIASQLFDRATYNAPAKVEGSANEVVLHARVTIDGPGTLHESVDAVRTIHVVNKKLRLTVTGHIATHCTPGTGGSVTMEYEVECKQTIDLEIGKDFTVSSANGKSCGASAWKGIRSCAAAGRGSVPKAKWALRSAVGKVDPSSAVMDLQIDGDRVSGPDVTWPKSSELAHTNALFPRGLTIGPDDNVMRVFGSMTTNATMGNQTTFELDAL